MHYNYGQFVDNARYTVAILLKYGSKVGAETADILLVPTEDWQ